MSLLLADFIYSRDCKLNLRKNVDTTIREYSQSKFSRRRTEVQMGDRYFLYSNQTGRIISVHDPGSV